MQHKYGVFIGRFQPFHIGHELAIREIIADEREPYIIVGGINKHGDERHPFACDDIHIMINSVFTDTPVIGVPDYKRYDDWWDIIRKYVLTDTVLEKSIMYIHTKPEDLHDFEFQGKQYINAHYTDIYKDLGIPTKEVTYAKKLGLHEIHATDIRNNLVGNKHLLHGKVYDRIKKILRNHKELNNG